MEHPHYYYIALHAYLKNSAIISQYEIINACYFDKNEGSSAWGGRCCVQEEVVDGE